MIKDQRETETRHHRNKDHIEQDKAHSYPTPEELKGVVPPEVWNRWDKRQREFYQGAFEDPNMFFYFHRPIGEDIIKSSLTNEEEFKYFERVEFFRNQLNISEGKWGLFAVPLKGRTGKECATIYNNYIINGTITDPNYQNNNGTVRYVPQSPTPPVTSAAIKVLEKEAKKYIADCYYAYINKMSLPEPPNPKGGYKRHVYPNINTLNPKHTPKTPEAAKENISAGKNTKENQSPKLNSKKTENTKPERTKISPTQLRKRTESDSDEEGGDLKIEKEKRSPKRNTRSATKQTETTTSADKRKGKSRNKEEKAEKITKEEAKSNKNSKSAAESPKKVIIYHGLESLSETESFSEDEPDTSYHTSISTPKKDAPIPSLRERKPKKNVDSPSPPPKPKRTRPKKASIVLEPEEGAHDEAENDQEEVHETKPIKTDKKKNSRSRNDSKTKQEPKIEKVETKSSPKRDKSAPQKPINDKFTAEFIKILQKAKTVRYENPAQPHKISLPNGKTGQEIPITLYVGNPKEDTTNIYTQLKELYKKTNQKQKEIDTEYKKDKYNYEVYKPELVGKEPLAERKVKKIKKNTHGKAVMSAAQIWGGTTAKPGNLIRKTDKGVTLVYHDAFLELTDSDDDDDRTDRAYSTKWNKKQKSRRRTRQSSEGTEISESEGSGEDESIKPRKNPKKIKEYDEEEEISKPTTPKSRSKRSTSAKEEAGETEEQTPTKSRKTSIKKEEAEKTKVQTPIIDKNESDESKTSAPMKSRKSQQNSSPQIENTEETSGNTDTHNNTKKAEAPSYKESESSDDEKGDKQSTITETVISKISESILEETKKKKEFTLPTISTDQKKIPGVILKEDPTPKPPHPVSKKRPRQSVPNPNNDLASYQSQLPQTQQPAPPPKEVTENPPQKQEPSSKEDKPQIDNQPPRPMPSRFIPMWKKESKDELSNPETTSKPEEEQAPVSNEEEHVEEQGQEVQTDPNNPLIGKIDPFSKKPMTNPMINQDGIVFDKASWVKIYENPDNYSPEVTSSSINNLVAIGAWNYEVFKDRIRLISPL